jgi:uncharacterized RDD family membrane protein YckC
MITAFASYAILIPVMVVTGVMAAASPGNEPPVWIVLLTYPLLLGLPVVYEALMLAKRGQTLGKMATGTKVVTPSGGPLTTGQAWARAALKMVLGSCFAIDYVPALFTHERTCLHDMIAKTRVVRVR